MTLGSMLVFRGVFQIIHAIRLYVDFNEKKQILPSPKLIYIYIDIAPEDGPQKKNSSSNPSICSDFPPPVYKRFTERRPGNLEASRRGKPPTSTWFCCRKVTISLEPKLRSVNFHHSTKSWRLLVVFCGSKKKRSRCFFV